MTDPAHVISATYRVVTPMFLSGADQDAAELRIPSIKGALRFWWRALAATRLGDDIERLKSDEAALFGSTDVHVGQSRVLMRLAEVDVTHASQHKFARNSWQSYMGFGLIDRDGQTQRGFIKPNSTFTLQMSCAHCNGAQRQQVEDAIIALGLLGGLGGRSRNGWGSVTLVALEGASSPWEAPSTPVELRDELTRRFSMHESPASWSAFSSDSIFEIGQAHDTSEAAHGFLANQYRGAVRDLTDKSQREAFGLPRKNAGRHASARRSGATFLHVYQVAGKKAIPVALCLPAQFLPSQTQPTGGWRAAKGFVRGLTQS